MKAILGVLAALPVLAMANTSHDVYRCKSEDQLTRATLSKDANDQYSAEVHFEGFIPETKLLECNSTSATFECIEDTAVSEPFLNLVISVESSESITGELTQWRFGKVIKNLGTLECVPLPRAGMSH